MSGKYTEQGDMNRMTREEYDELFEIDENGIIVRLVIPEEYAGKEVSYIGKKTTELTLDEVVLMKKYAGYLFNKVS